MSKTRNLSDLLDANGDVKSTALDNVPASDVVNDTTPQLGGDLDTNGNAINDTNEIILKINNTEKARLDTNGHVLVGTTDNSLYSNIGAGNGGVMLANTADGGRVDVAREGVNLIVNRLASDGLAIEVKKDAVTVGELGVDSNTLYIDGASNRSGIRFANAIIQPRQNGVSVDNITSLGNSSNRFKDLYLGGNIYLGGTGSANALDDYETGTWTPRFNRDVSLASVAYSRQTGVYTKIGHTVIAWFDLIVTSYSGGGGDYGLHGLPFTSNLGSSNGGYGIPSIRAATLMPQQFKIYGNSSYHNTNTDYFYFRHYNSSGTEVASSPNASGRVSGFTIYTTSS